MRWFILEKSFHNNNLNYNKVPSQYHVPFDPNSTQYDKNLELSFVVEYKDAAKGQDEISILDWQLLNRIRFFSVVGFGFERRRETLGVLKSDLLNEIISQNKFIEELRENLKDFQSKPILKTNLLKVLEEFSPYGFFYIKSFLQDLVLTI